MNDVLEQDKDTQAEEFANLISNKSKHEIVQGYRRCNLRHLISKFGGQTELSKELGYATSTYLTQMVGPSPIRGISEKNAREFEQKLGLPEHSLDTPVMFTERDLELKIPEDGEIDTPIIQIDGRRKYAKIDYSEYKVLRYLDKANLESRKQSPAYEFLSVVTQPEPPEKRKPTINESTMLELIELIESSELSSGKALKVLKMSVKDVFKKQALDTEFVQNLIELSK
jgi:hypothetical protein